MKRHSQMAIEGFEQRKLAAIMFTDMVGYSALAQRDEGLALELLDEHRALLRPAFLKHQGQEVKTIGDGFLVAPVSITLPWPALGCGRRQNIGDQIRLGDMTTVAAPSRAAWLGKSSGDSVLVHGSFSETKLGLERSSAASSNEGVILNSDHVSAVPGGAF